MQFIDLNAQQRHRLDNGLTIRELIDTKISEVLNHGKFILGPEVTEFEEELSSFVGSKFCIGVASGTDALLIALMALGIGPGDEVITTPFSFISTAETIVLLGAIPIFIDIDPITYNLDPNQIENTITQKTKAIIAVSLYGQPADFASINKVANKYGIPVIEDAAQSLGATQSNKKSGNLSTIGTTSFYPTKPLGCYGDGGACFTSDEELAHKMRQISNHGSLRRYFHTDIGINGRLDTIQAAILLAKLEIFSEEIDKRNNIAENYTNLLHKKGFKKTPIIKESNVSAFAQYTVQVERREFIQEFLKKRSIPTTVHYPITLNKQPALLNKSKYQNCNHAVFASEKVLSIPFHPYLEIEDQVKIVNNFIEAINSIS